MATTLLELGVLEGLRVLPEKALTLRAWVLLRLYRRVRFEN